MRGIFIVQRNAEHGVAFFHYQGHGRVAPKRALAQVGHIFFVSVAAVAFEHLELLAGVLVGGVTENLHDEAVLGVEVGGGCFFFVGAFALLPAPSCCR